MTQDDIGHAREIDVQDFRVAQYRVRIASCIEQDAFIIHLNQSRETPFTNRRAVGQVRGQNSDFNRFCLLRLLRKRDTCSEYQYHRRYHGNEFSNIYFYRA